MRLARMLRQQQQFYQNWMDFFFLQWWNKKEKKKRSQVDFDFKFTLVAAHQNGELLWLLPGSSLNLLLLTGKLLFFAKNRHRNAATDGAQHQEQFEDKFIAQGHADMKEQGMKPNVLISWWPSQSAVPAGRLIVNSTNSFLFFFHFLTWPPPLSRRYWKRLHQKGIQVSPKCFRSVSSQVFISI